MAALRMPLFTVEEYLAHERTAATKSEYIAGEIFAMSGGRPEHNMIAGDTYWILSTLSRSQGGGCTTHTSDQRVRVDDGGPFFYPDVSVVCGDPIFDDDYCLRNPALVVEVLSESTATYDRGEKFRNYRRLPSLRHYLLVDAERLRVEHYVQQHGVLWTLAGDYTDRADRVTLPDMGIEVPLSEIYHRVRFGEP